MATDKPIGKKNLRGTNTEIVDTKDIMCRNRVLFNSNEDGNQPEDGDRLFDTRGVLDVDE